MIVGLIALAGLAAGLGACSRSGDESTKLSKRVVPIGQRAPKGGGVYKVGNPYQVAGRWYYPKEDPKYDEVGIGSWYGDLFHGRYTANGEIFDQESLTAAHPTLPLPSYAEVTNLENGRSMVVRVNDRGPYAHNRVIDLSRRSAELLGYQRAGTARVRVRYLGKAPLDGDDSFERKVLASQPWVRVATAKGKQDKTFEVAAAAPPPVARPAEAPTTQEIRTAALARPASLAPATAAVEPSPAPGNAWRTRRPLFVQAGSYLDEEKATALRQQLSGVGDVHVYPAEIAGRMYYRVRVGPFEDRGKADAALQQVQAAGQNGARIVAN